MTTVGFSGHQNLPPEGVPYITREMQAYLASVGRPLVGLSSLAAGADQLFARAVLAAGGSLRAIIPSHDYAATFQVETDIAAYRELLGLADESCLLDFGAASEEAFFAAGRAVVDEADELLAVWDGLSARGLGGTADVVAYAGQLGKPVTVVWPAGLRR
ncbi:hypothetical protein FF36_02333 [Frankia torreyi]|uniref:Uncharacterized protein n=1 Tax=Frankia torreyi TaxID=1856 RepID=A0A0D8BH37_9ACTN|nr:MULTISPECIES: hypothetical protein [Frankia]KJE23375.1 hypothetical protein FF36_02333 [Frankia torreyi]KQC36483.1 hypothetical protein UK82_20855 [Frankia sp. ACN1ag]KQM05414.1 hypothetical protein FF86_101686 [Frankia sp. CpI1-P]